VVAALEMLAAEMLACKEGNELSGAASDTL
jgi:hypothetical protein